MQKFCSYISDAPTSDGNDLQTLTHGLRGIMLRAIKLLLANDLGRLRQGSGAMRSDQERDR